MVIQAGLFSAALVSFIIDKVHDLQVDPAQQLVYYQQQNVALLAQISTQVSSIVPQVPIPSTPPPPYPNFTPDLSSVLVNVFWFMSLVFSISAALLATLVQQWVQDYMHVFQRYSHPLEIARLRQYLNEGAGVWNIPVVAESVPGLIHVSVFFFFVGLGISLLVQNAVVGTIIVVLMTICGLPYIVSTFDPIINPKSPLRSPVSGLIWYLTQKLRRHPQKYSDHADGGAFMTVSPRMFVGQVQLAMKENEERKDRDARAIQWLIRNRTEDDEMEAFVMAIPGTFTSNWGIEVWRKVSGVMEYEGASSGSNDTSNRSEPRTNVVSRVSAPPSTRPPLPRPASGHRLLRIFEKPSVNINATRTQSISEGAQSANDPHVTRDPAINHLCKRIRRLLDTCKNLSPKDELRRERARGCISTVASLVFCAGVKLEVFGDIGMLLHELGDTEEIHKRLESGSDGSFVPHWTCLSLLTVTRWSLNDGLIKLNARRSIDYLSKFPVRDSCGRTNTGDPDQKA